MKLSGIEIEEAFETLQTLQEQSFNIETGCAIAKLIKQLQPKYIEIMNKKDELIKKYGDKDGMGNVILDKDNRAHISNNHVDSVKRELDEIYNNIYDIDAKYLKKCDLDKMEMPLKQIQNLLSIIE